MNKLKKMMIYIVIITIILSFLSYKTLKISEKISISSKSAIQYAQSIYKDMTFDMLSWNYNRQNQTYTITLVNIENTTIQLYCIVDPNFQEGEYFDVEILGGKNIDVNIDRNNN